MDFPPKKGYRERDNQSTWQDIGNKKVVEDNKEFVKESKLGVQKVLQKMLPECWQMSKRKR